MARTGHNSYDRYAENKKELYEYLKELHNTGSLTCTDGKYTVDNSCAIMDIETGKWINSSSGCNKANSRSYVRFPLPTNEMFMCADYWFKVICDGLFNNETMLFDKMQDFVNGITVYGELPVKSYTSGCRKEKMYGPMHFDTVINHCNGDVTDNSSDNLEACTNFYNSAHSYIMRQLCKHFPNVSSYYIDNLGSKHYKMSIRISSIDIEQYNNCISDIKYKLKSRKIDSYYSYDYMLDFLKFICNKHNYNIDALTRPECIDYII